MTAALSLPETRRLEFTVYGPPVPKARARVVGRRAITPERTRNYEFIASAVARSAVSKADWQLDNPAGYRVSIAVYRAARRGDLENFAKSICDSMNTIVYDDDRRIVELHALMFDDKVSPRVVVMVEAL